MDREDMSQWFDENGMDAISAMSEMLKVQQSISLGLTKLVLEHCAEGKFSKDEIFEIYQEASDLVSNQMHPDEQ